MNNKLMNH